ncbi:hypothetical protein PV703_30000 [Streptomyces sp. ME01-24h]|nr:hypothetical protein [Streptomyces sp. ME19-03-3]MDX3215183.1 hypothetical protein [Streptomyces sp. ME02-6991-2B]MDX3357461.1 hypothetical protein [Streptomyces sp. ME01-24h]
MPRPTPAQLTYGSATVVLSTLAMLLLSEARSGGAVAVIAGAGLVLGVLVAVTAAIPAGTRRAKRERPVERHPVPRHSVHGSAQARLGEHSLRR